MFQGWWHTLPDEEREQWELVPFETVGPLRFGMTPGEVTGAMDMVTADIERRTYRMPRSSPVAAVAEGTYRTFGLHLYYRGEALAGVVVDALRGPQVSVAGTALVGRVPSVLEQWLLDRAETRPSGTELTYLSAGVPASESLGVTINVQREGDRLLTRPVFYPADALDDLPHWLPSSAWTIHD